MIGHVRQAGTQSRLGAANDPEVHTVVRRERRWVLIQLYSCKKKKTFLKFVAWENETWFKQRKLKISDLSSSVPPSDKMKTSSSEHQ